jgi:hypothetical protein
VTRQYIRRSNLDKNKDWTFPLACFAVFIVGLFLILFGIALIQYATNLGLKVLGGFLIASAFACTIPLYIPRNKAKHRKE